MMGLSQDCTKPISPQFKRPCTDRLAPDEQAQSRHGTCAVKQSCAHKAGPGPMWPACLESNPHSPQEGPSQDPRACPQGTLISAHPQWESRCEGELEDQTVTAQRDESQYQKRLKASLHHQNTSVLTPSCGRLSSNPPLYLEAPKVTYPTTTHPSVLKFGPIFCSHYSFCAAQQLRTPPDFSHLFPLPDDGDTWHFLTISGGSACELALSLLGPLLWPTWASQGTRSEQAAGPRRQLRSVCKACISQAPPTSPAAITYTQGQDSKVASSPGVPHYLSPSLDLCLQVKSLNINHELVSVGLDFKTAPPLRLLPRSHRQPREDSSQRRLKSVRKPNTKI